MAAALCRTIMPMPSPKIAATVVSSSPHAAVAGRPEVSPASRPPRLGAGLDRRSPLEPGYRPALPEASADATERRPRPFGSALKPGDTSRSAPIGVGVVSGRARPWRSGRPSELPTRFRPVTLREPATRRSSGGRPIPVRFRSRWRGPYIAAINEPRSFTPGQLLFKELFVGTLIYAVVLGFFDDYTSMVEATSFSYVFLAAIVLEALTCGAFALKDTIVGRLRHRNTRGAIALMAVGVWFVMFASKFVFIWAIDLVFGDDVDINGFFGILTVALVVTVVHRLADWVFVRLGPTRPPTPFADDGD